MNRLSAIPATLLVLGLSTAAPPPVEHVYWGGDKVRRADLDGSNLQNFWNTSYGPVAVDAAAGRIYWGDNATLPGTIMWGNLNGGPANTLLTTVPGERIDDIEIDANSGMIYWAALTQLHIYRASITNPSSITLLPLTPATIGTLRDIALDTRPANAKLYWLTPHDVHRSDLNGTNHQQLPNLLGPGIFHGMAIDPCTDHIYGVGTTGGNPASSVIVRADLANAGNVTAVLQDSPWPPVNVGEYTRKIKVDPYGRKMYWTADGDANTNMQPTVRRADLNGTNMQIIAQGTGSPPASWSGELDLELWNTTCSTVGVNKDLQNNTGQVANDIEILIQGSYPVLNHYDGFPPSVFTSFDASPTPEGNTLLTWSSPTSDVQPGQIVHVGFNLPGSSVNILGVSWTRDGSTTGCPQQVSTNTHLWGSPGSQVIYANNCLACAAMPRYVGQLTVEWHARPVPLADLNPRTRRNPIRTDVIRRVPIRLEPRATARVDVPAAPPNARFGVIVHKVGPSAELTGRGVTTDFLEFPIVRSRTAPVRATEPARTN
jgi:hypothetical protein